MKDLEIMRRLKGKISLKAVPEIETDDERRVLWELIEKAIPEKPAIEGDGYADGQIVYDTWICPCCGERYETEIDSYKYCPGCGQRIDWSE